MTFQRNLQGIRRKAPQIVVIAIALAIIVYVLVEILEDIFVQGIPITVNPIVAFIVSLTQNATATVSGWGYWGVFVLMLLESSSLPIPSEVVLPFAGYLVSAGQLNFWVTVAVATVAGVLGALVDYYIGLRGSSFLNQRRILGRVIFSRSQLEVAAGWFGRYGAMAVFACRLIPGFRTIVSFPAGAVKMPLAKFVVFTTAGCLLWNGLLIYLGYFLGSRWQQVAGISHYIIIAAVVALAFAFVAFLVWRRNRAKRKQPQKLHCLIEALPKGHKKCR
jgi:membrane protein DedA with SNARE-associated domain